MKYLGTASVAGLKSAAAEALLRTFVVFVGLVVAAIVTTVQASTLLKYEFAGVVDGIADADPNKRPGVDPNLSSHFSVGEAFAYTFIIDTATPDNFPLNDLAGVYEDGVTSFSASIGDNVFGMGTDSFLTVEDGNNSEDGFAVSIHNPSHDPAFGSFWGTQAFVVRLYDTTAAVFASDSMPTSLDLDDFSSTAWVLSVDEGQVFGHITAVSVSTVPLPAALPLLMSALGFFGFLGWRKK